MAVLFHEPMFSGTINWQWDAFSKGLGDEEFTWDTAIWEVVLLREPSVAWPSCTWEALTDCWFRVFKRGAMGGLGFKSRKSSHLSRYCNGSGVSSVLPDDGNGRLIGDVPWICFFNVPWITEFPGDSKCSTDIPGCMLECHLEQFQMTGSLPSCRSTEWVWTLAWSQVAAAFEVDNSSDTVFNVFLQWESSSCRYTIT